LKHQNVPTFAYDVSKAALHALTQKLASEFAKDNIIVNAVAVGFVATKMTDGLETFGVKGQDLSLLVPLRRTGQAHDLAGIAIFLSSKAASWITGAVIPVDGGTLIAPYYPAPTILGAKL